MSDLNDERLRLAGEVATLRSRLATAEGLLDLVASAADAMPYAQHYGHFDREGGAGRTCPACIDERKQIDVIRERTKMARAFLTPTRPPCASWCGRIEGGVPVAGLGPNYWTRIGDDQPRRRYCTPACRDAGTCLNSTRRV